MDSLLLDFQDYIQAGYYLAIMPITRLFVDWDPIRYPHGVTFHSESSVSLDELGFIPNREAKPGVPLAEAQSAAAGVDLDTLERHVLVVFPCTFHWDQFRHDNHRNHLRFIRTLSQYVDQTLDVVRYYLCDLHKYDTLPGRAGTLYSNYMMASALLYNSDIRESRIIAGDAFFHRITKGLGLPLENLDSAKFPRAGEVGKIVQHALSLYTNVLESNNPTVKFTQCMSLLEFLAYPDEYKTFKAVKRIIARYVARSSEEYRRLLGRFLELTGKKDEQSGRCLGYRTRIIHMGEKIEDILPGEESLDTLFLELQSYIKAAIDHMILHSDLSWSSYLEVREKLTPYISSK